MYRVFFKRLLDILISFTGIILFLPIFLLLTFFGAINLKGNPFFFQERPGKDERVFRLIKFRTMTSATDGEGNVLPDEERLTKYGRFLRSTSLDELPELFNILIGDMSIVGPRPLLVCYLPLYSDFQRRRHLVRPGLTGYAQIHGRNSLEWEERFAMDVWYIDHLSFLLDLKIFCKTFLTVFKREGISGKGSETMLPFTGSKTSL